MSLSEKQVLAHHMHTGWVTRANIAVNRANIGPPYAHWLVTFINTAATKANIGGPLWACLLKKNQLGTFIKSASYQAHSKAKIFFYKLIHYMQKGSSFAAYAVPPFSLEGV